MVGQGAGCLSRGGGWFTGTNWFANKSTLEWSTKVNVQVKERRRVLRNGFPFVTSRNLLNTAEHVIV